MDVLPPISVLELGQIVQQAISAALAPLRSELNELREEKVVLVLVLVP
jgi:hypothetical protein